MSGNTPSVHTNTYHNSHVGAIPNALAPNPGAADEEFAQATYEVMKRAAEVARVLIGAHQSGIAIIVNKDWNTGRRYFSLSEKYARYADYGAPADGAGTHGWLLSQDKPVRVTQEELYKHTAWENFGDQVSEHPAMRGWLAAPLRFKDGTNWGLFQLTDKYDGDFTEEDERNFMQLVELVSTTIEALWNVRCLSRQNTPGISRGADSGSVSP